MGVYRRPLRSDELQHAINPLGSLNSLGNRAREWKNHKYLKKIGNRYFYTQEQLRGYMNRGQRAANNVLNRRFKTGEIRFNGNKIADKTTSLREIGRNTSRRVRTTANRYARPVRRFVNDGRITARNVVNSGRSVANRYTNPAYRRQLRNRLQKLVNKLKPTTTRRSYHHVLTSVEKSALDRAKTPWARRRVAREIEQGVYKYPKKMVDAYNKSRKTKVYRITRRR